jgi:hypothetical protein
MRLFAALGETLARRGGKTCFGCRAFVNDPKRIEAGTPGLTSFGSGYSSARGDDGVCLKYQVYLNGRRACAEREPL